MDEQIAPDEEVPVKPKKPAMVRWAPVIVVAVIVIAAFAIVSKPAPGRRTTTDTSVHMVIGNAQPATTTEYPITLQEGGDPAHEADHVLEPLQGVEGVAAATLDWSGGIVLKVEHDPDVVSAQKIANLMATSGYLSAPTEQ